MRTRRQVRSSEQIRELLESVRPYIPLNNRVFDDLYEMESLQYVEGNSNETHKTVLTDMDMIIFVFLVFLQRAKITLYIEEIAKYLKCSEKQVRESIKKLKGIQVDINNRHRFGDRKMRDMTTPLLIEKTEAMYVGGTSKLAGGKTQKAKVWYSNFEIDHKEEEGQLKAGNYFHVTIYDLDLFTEGKLSRKEFIVYLFILRIDTNNNQKFYIRYSVMAERLRIKGAQSTLPKYIQKLADLGLIEVNYPGNFDQKEIAGQEPSRELIPRFNRNQLAAFWSKHGEGDEQKVELDLNQIEDDWLNQ